MRRYQLIPAYALQTLTIVSTSPLPAGQAGVAYSFDFGAIGGVPPYTWSLASGTLPTGLTLTGPVLSGTPTAAGPYTFTIKVQDAIGSTFTLAFTMTVSAAAGAYVNPIGVLFAAGGNASLDYENFKTWKNVFREGRFGSSSATTTIDANGWPNNNFSYALWDGANSGANVPASFTNSGGVFQCGFTYTGSLTPVVTALDSCTVGALTHTGTSYFFTISNVTGTFGFNISGVSDTGSQNWFCYLPAYPATVVDNWASPSSITTEAAVHHSQFSHIRMEIPSNALSNTELCTSANRHTPANTQFNWGWTGAKTATLTANLAAGATSGVLTAWTLGPGTWGFNFDESGSFETRVCSVANVSGNWTLTWSSTRGLTNATTSTSIKYGLEGYPIEVQLALVIAASQYGATVGLPPVGLYMNTPMLEDGTSGCAGSYSTSVATMINSARTTYGWTGIVYNERGNEPWQGNGVTYLERELAVLYGYTNTTYMAFGAHQLANLGRTNYGSGWLTQVQQILAWQTGNVAFFAPCLAYMQTNYGNPALDVSWLAIAPYMNPTGLSSSSTVAQIEAATQANAATQTYMSGSENVAIAGLLYGIPLMAYESNAQWSSSTYANVTNLPAALQDSGMVAPYQTYYQNNLGPYAKISHSTGGVNSGSTSSGGGSGGLEFTNNWSNLVAVPPVNVPILTALQSFMAGYTPNRNVIAVGSGWTLAGGNYADAVGAALPTFPTSKDTEGSGSPYYGVYQGYLGWFYTCTKAGTTTLSVTANGSGVTNVLVGSTGAAPVSYSFSAPIGGGTPALVGSITIPLGRGFILLGNATVQSSMTGIVQLSGT